jgi:hypothetical protein
MGAAGAGGSGADAEQRKKAAEERIRGAIVAAQLRAARVAQLQGEATEVAARLARAVEGGDNVAAAASRPHTAGVPAWALYRQADANRDAVVADILKENRWGATGERGKGGKGACEVYTGSIPTGERCPRSVFPCVCCGLPPLPPPLPGRRWPSSRRRWRKRCPWTLPRARIRLGPAG